MRKSLRKKEYFKTEDGWKKLRIKVNNIGPANLITITESEMKYTVFYWEM